MAISSLCGGGSAVPQFGTGQQVPFGGAPAFQTQFTRQYLITQGMPPGGVIMPQQQFPQQGFPQQPGFGQQFPQQGFVQQPGFVQQIPQQQFAQQFPQPMQYSQFQQSSQYFTQAAPFPVMSVAPQQGFNSWQTGGFQQQMGFFG